MNKSIIFFAIIFFAVFMTACKKENVKPAASLSGYWTGSVGGAQFIGVLYRENGTARVFAGGADTTSSDKAEGIYSVDSDSIRTTVTVSGNTTFLTAKRTALNAMNGTIRNSSGSFLYTYSITKL